MIKLVLRKHLESYHPIPISVIYQEVKAINYVR